MIRLIRCFKLWPVERKSLASQIISSGFEAGFVARMSSTGSTIPRPIKSAQTRLEITCPKYGFSGAVTHLASDSRKSLSEFGLGAVDDGFTGDALAHWKRGLASTVTPVRGCSTRPDFPGKTTSSLPEIGGESPVPLRPIFAKWAARP